MSADAPSPRDVFLAAHRLPPGAWPAYLAQACGGDLALRHRVEELLAAHLDAGSFLAPGTAADGAIPIASANAEVPGTIIGPYRLLEVIGEGGMGTVYLAEQTHPVRRRVALKLIKAGMDTRQIIARFEAERQALAIMDHPNIAKVLDGGTTATGRPFFVMELVNGVPITDYCDRQHLTPQQRLDLFVTVCQAVQHAHQKGVIHRDIKPSNVLVTPHDDKPVVKVIDFGIAKATSGSLTEKTLITGFAQLVGTPQYMSPEQAGQSEQDIDTRSDIYSLGVLLYELLTGTTPLEKERLKKAGYDEIRRVIREEDPPKPSSRLSASTEALPSIAARRHTEPGRLTRIVKGDLDWIVMKAVEKDRTRRYETASAFAADVQRYLHDEPVEACPPSAIYRFRKFARRNRAALAIAATVGFAVLVAVAASVWSALLISRQQTITTDALDARTRARDDLEKTLQRERRDSYFHRIALADRELAVDNLGRALQLLGECPEDLRAWEWYYLMRLCRAEPVVLRNESQVNSIAFSPDGEHLASANGDGAIKVWDSRTCTVTRTLEHAHGGFVCSVAFHPDGRHLGSVGADKLVKVWDLTTGRAVFARPCDSVHVYGAAYAVAFSLGDGRQLAAGSDGAMTVWDWKNDHVLHEFSGHEKLPISVAYGRDGQLATGSWWGSVKLWDTRAGGGPVRTFQVTHASRHPISALAFDGEGRRLAAASYDRRVDVWDTATGGHVHELPHRGLVLGAAFSPDGRRLVSAGEDKIVRLWDAATGREILGLRGHTGVCGSVAFSPDGARLASASKDGTIRLWDATPLRGQEGQETLNFDGHRNEIWSLAVSPDSQSVVSAGFGTPAMVWDLQSGRLRAEFTGHRDIVFCVAWQPDGRRIASAGGDGSVFTVKVWDPETGREDFALPATVPGRPEYFAVAFSPDGKCLVTGSANQSVQVWDARTGEQFGAVGFHERVIRGVVLSHDGRHLASLGDSGEIKLWDATRLNVKQDAPRHSLGARVHGQCSNFAFSPDGLRLATGGEENTVKIWNVTTGKELRTLRGHSGDIYTVAFSPDPGGRWIASAGEDSTVKVFDSQTGKPVRSFRGHIGLVSSLAFTPDGRHLVSGSRDHSVKVWDVSQLEDRVDH